MDASGKFVEMSEQLRYCANVSDCANCKRWDKVCGNKCVDSLLLMAADLIDEVANGVTVQEWISVEDRLPEKDGQYLIFTTKYFTPDHIDEIDHIDGTEISVYSKRFGFLSKNGLHAKYWCELPQPPKGE